MYEHILVPLKSGLGDEVLVEHAASLVPGAPGIHNDLGITLTAARRMPESLASFERAIQIAGFSR